jgi:DNA-binding MarR family transcriptional regulator
MDSQELRTLQILEEIEKDHIASQRYLARKLNVSLGLVNAFIKRMAHKGYFKATTIPKNRVKYMLTPKGAAEKTRLTYLYIQHSLAYYKTARSRLRELFQNLAKAGISKVVFYGATELAEIAYVSLQETDIDLVAVIDQEKAGRKRIWGQVAGRDALLSLSYDTVLVTETGDGAAAVKDLLDAGVRSGKIATLE